MGGEKQTALMLSAAVLVMHLAANAHYGFFRDELYFIVCGRHPAFGYVDQPPVVPLLAAGSQIFGTSLFALRAVPALFAAGTAFVVSLLVRDMGGGRYACLLAVIAASLAPVLAAFGTILGPDTVQSLVWAVGVLCIGRALNRSPVWWLVAGLAFGIAAEAKYSAIMVAAALLAGVAVTRPRVFVERYVLGGMAIAAVLVLPNAIWQAQAGFPMLELLRNGQQGKNVVVGAAGFLGQQLVLTNPLLAPIWVIGVVACLVRSAWRWLGIGFVGLLTTMIVLHGKAYYPAPIYPVVFAAGAVAMERWMQHRLRFRVAAVTAVVVFGLALAPFGMPILGEPRMAAYMAAVNGTVGGIPAFEHHRSAALGQVYADMHGWPELAGDVARIYRGLTQAERGDARIFTSHYGEAAAIDVLGADELPPVLSGHNQYWLWGPRGWNGRVLIDVGGDLEQDRVLCGSAVVVGTFSAPWVMPYEDDLPIVLCRDLRQPVERLWARLKHYD